MEFLRRSYFAVDGLWFVKCEDCLSLKKAFELDKTVWEIMAKIQARKSRELTGAGKGLDGLGRCLSLKFESEGWKYRLVRPSDNVLKVEVTSCPWYHMLEKSDRTFLEPQIAEVICESEHQTWASEFGEGISFSLHRDDGRPGRCSLIFKKTLNGNE